MARSEGRILTSIWSDKDFVARTPRAQRLYLFLLSQPDLGHAGVIPLRVRRWSRLAAGLDEAQIRDELAELAEDRFVVIDEDAEELLVRSLMRNDRTYRQPNVFKAAVKEIRGTCSPTLRAVLLEELRRLPLDDMSEDVAGLAEGLIEELEEASPKGSGNPSEGVRGTPREEAGGKGKGERGKGNPKKKGARNDQAPADQRGTRLPDEFPVTPEMARWARENTPLCGVADHEAFCDYWQSLAGPRARKVDWVKTWKNWMRREQERRATRNGPSARASPGDPPRSTTDQRVGAALDLAARLAEPPREPRGELPP